MVGVLEAAKEGRQFAEDFLELHSIPPVLLALFLLNRMLSTLRNEPAGNNSTFPNPTSCYDELL